MPDSTDAQSAQSAQLQQRKKQLIAEKKWVEAAEVMQQLVHILPTADHHNQLGFLYLQLQRYDAATAAFTKALQLAPDSRQAQDGLARSQAQSRVSSGHGLTSTSEMAAAKTAKKDEPLPRFGRYQMRRELGRGGMGIVYQAYDSECRQEVALKTIPAECDDNIVQRFARETEAMSKLVHPNIVRIFDVGKADGRPYFTMEFITGKSLAQQVLLSDKLPVRRVVEIMHQVTLAIAYAHSQGILHRDLKPANIMFDHNNAPRVMDFGLALDMTNQNRISYTGVAVGTPAYMPPEQVMGKKKEIDARSDIYALGVVLYELLAGSLPFRGQAAQLVRQILHQDPAPISPSDPRVPAELDRICLKAMAKEKADRYQSANEMADDLERFLQQKPVTARPLTRRRKWLRWIRKHPGTTAIYGAALLVLVAIATEIFQLTRQANRLTNSAPKPVVSKTNSQEIPAVMAALASDRLSWELQRQSVQKLVDGKRDDSTAALLSYVRSSHFAQRIVAIEAIGKIGDTRARLGYKDTGECLLERLDSLDIAEPRQQEEAEAIVWALGRLADARAERKVSRLRWQAGEESVLWENTILPYSWIPLSPLAEGADASSRLRQGRALMAKQNPTGAIRELSAAIAMQPGMADAYLERGRAYAQQKEFSLAVEDFSAAIARQPDLAMAYCLRGSAKSVGGEPWQGLEDLNKAIEMSPRHAKFYCNRGVTRTFCKDIEGALQDFAKALEVNPSYQIAYLNRVVTYQKLNMIEQAKAEVERALQVNPRYAQMYAARANFRSDDNDMDGAFADNTRAIEYDPRNYIAYANRGLIKEERGDFAGAIADYEQAIIIDSSHPQAYFNRAKVREKMGNIAGALADYDMVITLAPEHVMVYKKRAELWRQQGKHQAAVSDYQRYLKLRPNAQDREEIVAYLEQQDK